MVSADDLLKRISYHAVVRYVQRILLVDVPDDVLALPAIAQAEKVAALAGKTVEELRREMLNPALAAALLGGFSHMACTLFTAKLQRAKDGKYVVTTMKVSREDKRRMRRPVPLKTKSRTEHRKECHRYARRNKGKSA